MEYHDSVYFSDFTVEGHTTNENFLLTYDINMRGIFTFELKESIEKYATT